MNANKFFVDWITARLAHTLVPVGRTLAEIELAVRQVGLVILGVTDWEPTKPRLGYRLAWQSKSSGARLMWHEGRPEMGLLFIASGSTLSFFDWRDVLVRLVGQDAIFTRIDVAVDVHDTSIDLERLYTQFLEGDARSRAMSASLITSTSGDTLYVGARTSEKFLRIYDKGKEQGEDIQGWYRIELECKGSTAEFVGEQLAYGDTEYGQTVIRGFSDWPKNAAWVANMNTLAEVVNVPSNKALPDTEVWLLGLVATTMAKIEKLKPGFLDQFYDQVVDKL